MPNARYANGRKLEYAAQEALEANGYWTIRAPGSKGAVDVVALKAGETLLVQCKLDGYMTPADRSRLWELARTLRAVPLVACWRKEGQSARTVAFARLVTRAGKVTGEIWTPDHALEVTA